MTVLLKQDLVDYLITTHSINEKKDITPIKLQKALYFLYAFYAGKVSFLNLGHPFAEEVKSEEYDVELFDADFQAWVYGPVDAEVYRDYKAGKLPSDSFELSKFIDEVDPFALGFLEDTVARIFNTSDFTLVDLSHDDESWKSKFDRDNIRRSSPIENEDIINEYAIREFI